MPDPAEVACQRAQARASKLVEALDELDDAGGLKRLAPRWRPGGKQRAMAQLKEARAALDAARVQLEGGEKERTAN